MNDFISPIGWIQFTTLKILYFRRSMREIVDLKYNLKWSRNESNFCPFLKDIGHWRNDRSLFSLMSDICYLYK